jgi:hypothetical protein
VRPHALFASLKAKFFEHSEILLVTNRNNDK